jgi:2-polyprenyl-3-methyl-5-hydroxy-6-metoxy-1,4-benzoquinol methylase
MSSLDEQRRYWTRWNQEKRRRNLSEVSARQRYEALRWLDGLDRTDLDILEVGCGSAWMTPSLKAYGRVTATDLSAEVLAQVAPTIPGVDFIAGDFLELSFPPSSYDVVVTFEVLAHVRDQRAFLDKIASVLKLGGLVMLATQNRPVLERMNRVPPTEGQLRHWVDRHELSALLATRFEVLDLRSVTPRANRGAWRFASSRAVQAPLRFMFGDRVERLMERHWLGWTLLALARKRTD